MKYQEDLQSKSQFWVRCVISVATVLQLLNIGTARAEILKVLSLNMNSEVVVEDRDYRFRDRRFPEIVEWILNHDVDIVFIQEGYNYHDYGSVVKRLGEKLGYDYAYRIGMGAPFLLYDSNGILAKPKFHLSQERNVILPHDAPWIGDGENWVIVFGAISWAVGASLTLEDGSLLYAYTSHLIGNSQSDRNDQIASIDLTIREHALRNNEDFNQVRVLVGADLNSSPDSTGVQNLLQLGYQDTFDNAHPGSQACTSCPDPTSLEFNPMTIASGQFPAQDTPAQNERIDYLFMHGPEMQTLASTLTFTAPVNGVWMSDHFGVFSTIAVGKDSGTVPGEYPNPLRDRDNPGRLGEIIHVTDEMLYCYLDSEKQLPSSESGLKNCELPWLDDVSAEHGITFINESSYKILIRVRPVLKGQGQVWARQRTDLDIGHVASFFFDPGLLNYTFGIKSDLGAVYGSLRSDLK